MGQQTISLCMIAKDEAHIIAQAIESVSSIISEVVLVDTGSTDSTISIAEKFGAKIIHHPWQNNFSEPRNIGFENATCDWILVLDADEVISKKDLPILLKHTNQRNHCFELTQRHYTSDHRISQYEPVRGENPELERDHLGFFESSLVRLVPRHSQIRYEGRIHELLEHSIARLSDYKIARSPVRLHHYGHTEEIKKLKNKHSIYGPLGETKSNENPHDWKGFFELGVENNCAGKLEESAIAFKRSIELLPSYHSSWVNLGYVLCELGRYEDAIETLTTAIRMEPRSSEALCNLGVVYLRLNQLPLAERCFREAIKFNPIYVNAYLNLSRVLAGASRLSEAAQILYRVLDFSPKHERAKTELELLYAIQNQSLHNRRSAESSAP